MKLLQKRGAVPLMEPMIRGRFAPSPSGRMHLGNVYAALLAWLSVRSVGGSLVLRMEDLDPQRCREDYAKQLVEDLLWLGLDWDVGYQIGGDHPPYLQSKRTHLYAQAFEKLQGQNLIYPCFCTRAERLAASAPHRSDGSVLYGGRCKSLTSEELEALSHSRRPAWRVAVPQQDYPFLDGVQGEYSLNLAQDCGDFIVRRSDGVYAYQLAVVVDDGAMGVNQVVRGQDLLDSTPPQLWLYEMLGLTPPAFYHVPLLCAPDGRRLSKRDGDLDMGALRQRFTPPEIIGKLAFLAGQQPDPAPITAQALAKIFSWDNVPTEDIMLGSLFD